MGQSNSFLLSSAIVILIILIIIIFFLYHSQPNNVVIINNTEPVSVQLLPCPINGIVQGEVKYEDNEIGKTTYKDSSDVWFVSDSVHNVKAKPLSVNGWSESVGLICREKYRPTALTSQDGTTSVYGRPQQVYGIKFQEILLGQSIRQLEVIIPGFEIINKGGISTKYQQLDSDNTKTSPVDIIEDGYIDINLFVKTNESNTVFGEETLFTYLCVANNNNIWDEPLITVGDTIGKNSLVDMFERLKSNDKKALLDFDYCYNIGQMTDSAKLINYYQETVTGADPTSDDSVILYFIAEGRFLSEKEKDAKGDQKILVGAFKDDNLFTPVAVSNKQKIELVVK